MRNANKNCTALIDGFTGEGKDYSINVSLVYSILVQPCLLKTVTKYWFP